MQGQLKQPVRLFWMVNVFVKKWKQTMISAMLFLSGFAVVIAERLEATRIQLLDIYGKSPKSKNTETPAT
jgi:hypothetical protein